METTIPEVCYEACWTEDDGLYACGCGHPSIAEAMACVARDGRHFIRAIENGKSRSLNDQELSVFITELINRPPKRV